MNIYLFNFDDQVGLSYVVAYDVEDAVLKVAQEFYQRARDAFELKFNSDKQKACLCYDDRYFVKASRSLVVDPETNLPFVLKVDLPTAYYAFCCVGHLSISVCCPTVFNIPFIPAIPLFVNVDDRGHVSPNMKAILEYNHLDSDKDYPGLEYSFIWYDDRYGFINSEAGDE